MNHLSYSFTSQNDQEIIATIILVSLGLFFLLVIRNWYNLYKKRSFRKQNRILTERLELAQIDLKKNDDLKLELSNKHTKIFELEQKIIDYEQKFYAALSEKEKEIAQQKDTINHQKKAYERYVNFKNVETNNTRMGAHFIKNVISQIYEDMEDSNYNSRSFFNLFGKSKETKKKLLPLKALKNIFKLLDYNVAALNKESTTIEDELLHIKMFLDLIKYLKPNAKIEFQDLLSKNLKNEIKIKPTLFFPFVENALKHGALNGIDSFINIELKQDREKEISYCLINTAEQRLENELDKNPSVSFGLNALQQLLDAYYPGSKLKYNSIPNRQYMSQLTLKID